MTTESPEHRKENLKRKNGVLLHETSTLHEKSKFQRTEKVEITVGLLKQMKSHQIEAANFVLRLLSQSSDTIDWLNEPSTGAILADDVGTGKTLVGLVVMYSLTRHFNSKGIIVAPSSLIINWKNEMKKWLPINAYNSTLFVQSNSRSDALVYKFIHSSSESIPLLVISYDLFRTFSESFNTMTNLSCLLCDEGHRMKNAGGTKTSSALSHCVAMRRLVLTGTPIQNNPDELYALIQFVSPNYLGSLSDFKARYLKDEEGKKELRIKLSKILLRRSKEEILRRDLPPRVDVIIRCPLNSLEQNMMLETVDAEVGAGKNELSDILPTLMKVRLLCSIPPPKSPSLSIPIETSISSKISAVLQIIESMIQLQRKDKIVIVSNFTMVLDAISQSLKARRLSCFRIDGSVPLEKRARIVVKFNEAENPIEILLLSAKAGGVGLTLTGANRLVLMEPDWNPATDAQCMGRVWRTGQKKQVFIYRMIMLGTIEESILERQGVKEKLSSLIRQPNAADLAVQDITEGKSDDEEEKDTEDESLSLLDVQKKGEILQLVLPRGRDFLVEPTPSPRESLFADNSAGIDNVLDMMREPRMIIETSSTD